MAAATGRGGPLRASLLSDRALVLLREARWLLLCTLALFVALILLSYDRGDPGWSHAVVTRDIHNYGGRVGAWTADLMLYLFGLSAYLWAVFLLLRVVSGYRRLHPGRLAERREAMDDAPFGWDRWLGFALLFAGCMSLESSRLAGLPAALPLAPGGLLGQLLAGPMLNHLGPVGGTLLMLLLTAVGFSLATGLSWLTIFERVGAAMEGVVDLVRARWEAHRDRRVGEIAATVRKETVEVKRKILHVDPEPLRIEPPPPPVERSERALRERQKPLFADLPADTELPPLSLLDAPLESQDTVSPETLEYTSRLIEKKLSDFGVSASVVAAYPGPVITRYEIEPATGIKGSMIVNLSKDLARALSLVSIRVVETIPGKSLMGLELPNARRQSVRLSEVLASQVFADSASPVTLALGHDIAGRPLVADLAKMPHLLVAGTTGSGKSVGINAMILSLLYKSSPKDVRMIMIDPKMLELSVYDGIPHLLTPVVTDMKDAANALRWSVAEMERRYKLMSALGVRNLAGFNKKVEDAIKEGKPIFDPIWRPDPMILQDDQTAPALEPLPTIVVVVDELADMMMVVGKKVEELIARIAQKARAAGIHLILATQRPSVDVLTGLIKANIPTRLSFMVQSKVDSRTILGEGGAEQLLGHGDMLFLPPGGGLARRVHGAFVSDEEVHRVVADWKSRGAPVYIDEITQGVEEREMNMGNMGGGSGEGEEDDALYDEAVAFVTESRKASISAVQRKLRIGYNRAARMIESMEAAGVVSEMGTNGSREVLAPPPPR
jgi:S-DNA-T family DNA segregation ATPase FtsK/SpoIIIE